MDTGVRSSSAGIVQESLRAQERLWPLTAKIVRSKPPGPIEASLVAAVNEVIDLHSLRLAAGLDRLPPPIVWMLILIASASISVAGFNAGLSGFISRWRMSALTFVLGAVMMTVVDFDRPRSGLIRVSQEPLQTTADGMASQLGLGAGG